MHQIFYFEKKITFISSKNIPFFLGESSWFVAAAKAREAMAIKVIKQWKDFSMFSSYQLTTDSSVCTTREVYIVEVCARLEQPNIWKRIHPIDAPNAEFQTNVVYDIDILYV